MMQEVDRVVARVQARENEQHDALSPVQTFVNAHMQVLVHCLCLFFALILHYCLYSMLAAHLWVNAQHWAASNFVQQLAVPCAQAAQTVWLAWFALL